MRFFAFFHFETIFGAELQMKLNFDGDVTQVLVEMSNSHFGGDVRFTFWWWC